MTDEPVTPAAYYDLCQHHDWHFDHADDRRAYKRGLGQRQRLQTLALQNPELRAIFDAWREHIFSGPLYGTDKQPRPQRPADPDGQALDGSAAA